ncbi:MAG: MarR family transcriptional regulator [Deltaproteobacteria bacterium]|nr:MarR family transcriptional regulator [Deltaproteobacteria bacterium]
MHQYEDCIIFLLAKAYQGAQGLFKKKLKPYNLTPVQHLILEALWEEDGLSAGEIGKRLILDHATVSGVLDRMAESGWIVKETDQADKRFIRVYLSNKAQNIQSQLIRVRDEANKEILAGLTLEEKVLFKRLLRSSLG